MNATHAFLIVEALQATAIVGAALVLMLCAIRRSALRHALGVVGLGLLLTSPLLTLVLPRPAWLPEAKPPVAPVAEVPKQPVAPLPMPTEFGAERESIPRPFEQSWPYEPEFATLPPMDAFETSEDIEPALPAPIPAASAPTWHERWNDTRTAMVDRLPMLFGAAGVVWMLGTLWCVIRWRRSHVRLRQLRESLIDWPQGRPIDDAGAICEELGLPQLPPIKVSAIAPMPLVLGVQRPAIVLPQTLADTHHGCRLRDVVLHEAAHIARRDPLVFVVQRTVAALFWWNPGVHWLNRAINRAREEVCDNHVLRRGDAAAYAELLVELVESYAGLRVELSLMGLLARRWSLEQRIAGLLNPHRNTRTRAGRVQTLSAAVLLLLLSAGVGGLGILGRLRAETELTAPTDATEPVAAADSGETTSDSGVGTAAHSESWPNFRNGSDQRGIAGTTLPEKLELLWELETHDGVTSTAAIADGRAYVADLSGFVRCVDLHSGREFWHFRTIESEDPEEFAPGFNAPVTLSETAVFIGDEEGTFYALDRKAGALLWKIKTDDEIKGGATVLPPDPITGEARVMFGSHDGQLYCLNAATGDQLWAFDARGPVNGSQAVAGQFTFVSGCDRPVLQIVDVNSGEQHAWIPLDDSLLVASPALVDNVLYFGTQDGNINAFDWQSKLRMWIWSDPKQQQIHSSPAVTEDLVLIGSRDKRLHAINRTNGEGVWAFETRGPIDSSPVVVGERIFFGSADRHVYAVDLQGREVWKYRGGGRISSSPAVGEEHLVIGCEGPGGKLLCFGAKRDVAAADTGENQPAAPTMRKVTLRGVCRDEHDEPLASVRVRVFRFPSSIDPPELVAEAATGVDGTFEFQEIESAVDRFETHGIGDLFVAATAVNRRSAGIHVEQVADVVDLALTLEGDPTPVTGVVRDRNGAPVAGATVFAPTGFTKPIPGMWSAVTDANGRYTIGDFSRSLSQQDREKASGFTYTFTSMRWKLLVEHPDYGTVNVWNAAAMTSSEGVQRVDVSLQLPAVIEGRVLDSLEKKPAAGVIVSAQGIGRDGWYQARTDRDGRYRLLLTKDHYNIWAEMPHRIPIAVKAIEARPGMTVSGADIPMVLGAWIVGEVRDGGTNEPISPTAEHPVYVFHHGPARPRTGDAVTAARVDEHGTYSLHVAPGRNYVYLQDNSNGVFLDVRNADEVRHDFRLGEQRTEAEVQTDPDAELGRRIREQARAEDEAALQRAPGAGAAPDDERSAVPPARDNDGDRVDTSRAQEVLTSINERPATRNVTLRGVCRDENEQPLAGVRVRVFRFPSSIDPPELVAEATTGVDGRFEFKEVESAIDRFETRGVGDLYLAVTADGRRSVGTHFEETADDIDRTFTLLADAKILSGFVRDSNGKPVVGATVYAPLGFEEPIPDFLTAVTDNQGRYSLPHYLGDIGAESNGGNFRRVVGRSKLHVSHPDFGILDIWRPSEQERFDLTLHPPAVITGQIIDAVTDRPTAGVIVTAQGIARRGFYQTRSDSEGRYTLRLTKDHYNIWAELPDRIAIAVKAIEAKPGETVSGADIRMVHGGIVYGSVVDPATGTPVQPKAGEPMRVAHQGPARPRTDRVRTYTTVNADGTYRLRVAPGRNLIFLSNSSRGEYIDVPDGGEVEHDVEVGRGIDIDSPESDPDVKLREQLIREALAEETAPLREAQRQVDPPGSGESAVAQASERNAKDEGAVSAQPAATPAIADPVDLGRSGHFGGQVTGPDGHPLAGARIYIVRYPRKPTSAWRETQMLTDPGPVRAVTDSDGRYAFDAPDMLVPDQDGQPARTEGLIIAAADGYAPDWKPVWDRGQLLGWERRRESQLSFDLQLSRDDVAIEGQLLDPEGRPLAGGVIRVSELRIPDKRTLDTYIDYWSRDNSGVGNGPEFERSISTPAVLPGMMVQVATDAEGRFTISGLGDERIVELWVTAPGMVESNLVVMTRKAPEVGTRRWQGKPQDTTYGADFSVRLEAGRTVTGVVIDRETRKPIPGMWVGIGRRNAPNETLASGRSHRATDENGRFTITGVWPKLLESGSRSFREVVAVAPPGVLYETTTVILDPSGELVIECRRGIPFRLKVTDEQGQPVIADVTYVEIQPNPHSLGKRQGSNPYARPGGWPISRAAHRGDGVYEGFVLPGPGAVLVQTPDSARYRPAHVDPKGFFAPGRTEWTAQEQITAYGTHDTLSTSQVWINQHDYSAIILISPAGKSAPLELTATVYKDRPRQVILVDPDGQPVVGATTEGMTFFPWDHELPLRSATFPVTGLRPDWGRRITFYDEPRKLIGFLSARGDGETPYKVPMRPWASVGGRIVDGDGNPVKLSLDLGYEGAGTVVDADPEVGIRRPDGTDASGLFSIDKLVPGQRYTARAYREQRFWGMAFEDLVLAPGETRDLGEIRLQRPADDTLPANQSENPTREQGATSAPTADPAELGRIEGQFVFDGEPPQLPPVSTHGGVTVPDESLIVNPGNKGIANVCVYLEETPQGMPNAFRRPGGAPPVFDTQNGRFVPHVLVLRSDQQVRLLNGERETVNPRSSGEGGFSPLNMVLKPNERDGVTHNIHYADMRRPPVTITSELQPWMRAYWLVSNHPYVAVTDADGKFRIANLPPGEHTFRVWHERAGYVTADAFSDDLTVTVKPGETVPLPTFRVKAAEFAE